MSSILKVDEIQDTSGNNIINENAGTITVGKAGNTTNIVGTLQNDGAALISGITEADMYRLTADLNSNADPISSNLERVDDATFSKIGTGISVSSGIFSFSSTGLYHIQYSFVGECNNDGYNVYMYATTDNSTYDLVAAAAVGGPSGYNVSSTQQTYVNVTDTSNVKVKFVTTSMAGNNNTRMYGDTDLNWTTFTFIRLGDSQ